MPAKTLCDVICDESSLLLARMADWSLARANVTRPSHSRSVIAILINVTSRTGTGGCFASSTMQRAPTCPAHHQETGGGGFDDMTVAALAGSFH